MKPTVLLLTVLGCVAATPNGYYHQEYNYKTSASSYKNNELQHKTDDQGYYRKDGDLAGRTRPRVDANSEHSEYVNPNLQRGQYNTGMVGGANGDMSSYGHMRADVGSYGTRDQSSEGVARADSIVGNRGGAYSDYNSGSYGSSNYGSSSQSYGISSNLRSVTTQLEQDLERDLQRAIQEQRAYSQSNVRAAELERELRQNLTNRLNAELSNRYGQQSIRGGLSYTISGGRLHSTANYDNQELQDLRSQLENRLLNQLKTQYQQSSNSQYSSQQSSLSNYGYSTTTLRPIYYTHLPATYGPIATARPTYTDYNQNYVRYPVQNTQSLTNIASKVQNQLDTRLNQLLDDTQRRYFSSASSYSLTNTDVILENLRNELRNNITYFLNEEVKANYGTQIPRDGYMYSVGSGGQTASQHNYSIQDLENLRSQIERNLIEKLNRDFETHRSRWQQSSSYSQSSHSSNNVRYGSSYNTPRYDTYSTYTTPRYVYRNPQQNTYNSDVENFSTRPSASHIAPLITSGGSSSNNRQYNLMAGSSHSGYEMSGSSSSGMSQLQRQLQQDLSRQLQAALSRSRYSSYSSYTNPQSYQTSLQELSDELNRNLTRQLQEYSASGSYSAYGNFDQTQMANLRNQLQSDLMRQLQQGLQQSYQSSSSYSASASSSSSGQGSYRPVRGFDNYQSGQYRSGGSVLATNGADCVGDDPNAYTSHRMKRSHPPYGGYSPYQGHSSYGAHSSYEGQSSYGGYQPYRSQHIGLDHRHGHGYGYYHRPSYDGNYRGSHRSPYGLNQQQELGQQVDESDLTQQTYHTGLTQRVEDSHSGNLQLGSQQQVELGQVDESDSTQQVEDVGSGRLQVGSHGQQQVELGQQVDNSDLTQQVQDPGYGRLQQNFLGQQQENLGQQVEDTDLTQQVEDSPSGKLQLGSQQQTDQGQQVDESDLTQQVEDVGYGRWQVGSQRQQQQAELGQQVDDSDSTQQVEDAGYGRLEQGSLGQQQEDLGQQVEDTELTQQVEDSPSGKLQLGSHQQTDQGQQVDESDPTRQIEDGGYGRWQVGSQRQQQQVGLGQQVDDSDSTQQVEDGGYGRLEQGSLGQQQEDLGQQVEDTELTQQVDDSPRGKLQLGSHQQTDQGQQVDESDLTRQIEDGGYGRWQVGSQRPQQQVGLGQQVDDSDLTQQVEGVGYGRFQVGAQGQQQVELGQQVDDSDSTPQVEYPGYGRLQTGSQQQQTQLGQQVDDSDLTQQVQDVNYDRLQQSPQRQQQDLGQQTDDSQLTQQVEVPSGKLQFSSQQSFNQGQQVDNSDLMPQEDVDYGRFQLGSQGQQHGQQVDNSEQTQQAEDSGFEKLQVGSHATQQNNLNQELNTNDLSQQVQDSTSGKLQIGSSTGQQQEVGNLDLIQQVDDLNGKLQQPQENDSSEQYSQDLTQQQTDNLDSIQQAEDGQFGNSHTLQDNQEVKYVGLGKLQLNSQNQLQIQRGSTRQENQYPRQEGNSYLGGQVQDGSQSEYLPNQNNVNSNPNRPTFGSPDRSDLTQQVEDPAWGESPLAPPIPQGEDFRYTPPGQQQTEFGQQEIYRPYTNDDYGTNINQKERQVASQLKDELYRQLKEGVKTYYSTPNSAFNYESDYQALFRDLESNITKQLQDVKLIGGDSGGSYLYVFSTSQVDTLRERFVDELRRRLQHEISNVRGSHFRQQQIYNTRYDGEIMQQNSNAVENPQLTSQQQTLTQPPVQYQQSGDVNQLPAQTGVYNRPTYNYHFSRPQATGFRRPVQQRPVDSNKFLENEITQQQYLYPNTITQQNNNKPNDLTTLNQVTRDQQATSGDEDANTAVVDRNEETVAGNDFNQQVAINLADDRQEQSLTQQVEDNSPPEYYPITRPQPPNRDAVGQQNNLPTLNQVIREQQRVPETEVNTVVPEYTDQLTDLNQQPETELTDGQLQETEFTDDQQQETKLTDDQQQQGSDFFPESSVVPQNNQLPSSSQTDSVNQNFNRENPVVQPTGEGRVTNQEEFTSQGQSLAEAERQSDLLIQALQKHIRDGQSTSGQGSSNTNKQSFLNQGSRGYGDVNQISEGTNGYIPAPQQTDSYNQHQDSFQLYLRRQQAQAARQLENDLSKQLRDAISSQNYRIVTYSTSGATSPQLYQTNFEQLSRDLQRNITKQLEETFNRGSQSSYSSYSYRYGSLTEEQKRKLIEDLQADLSRQLEQELQVKYGSQQQATGQNRYNSRVTYSTTGGGSYESRPREIYSTYGAGTYSGHQSHYGQQDVVPQNEEVEELEPIEPRQPSVVQNIDSEPTDYNIGVKGRGRAFVKPQSSQLEDDIPTPEPAAPIPVVPIEPVPEVADIEVQQPQSETQTLPVNTNPVQQQNSEPQENLPWWKKFGHKVRDGAVRLKEKIVG